MVYSSNQVGYCSIQRHSNNHICWLRSTSPSLVSHCVQVARWEETVPLLQVSLLPLVQVAQICLMKTEWKTNQRRFGLLNKEYKRTWADKRKTCNTNLPILSGMSAGLGCQHSSITSSYFVQALILFPRLLDIGRALVQSPKQYSGTPTRRQHSDTWSTGGSSASPIIKELKSLFE